MSGLPNSPGWLFLSVNVPSGRINGQPSAYIASPSPVGLLGLRVIDIVKIVGVELLMRITAGVMMAQFVSWIGFERILVRCEPRDRPEKQGVSNPSRGTAWTSTCQSARTSIRWRQPTPQWKDDSAAP